MVAETALARIIDGIDGRALLTLDYTGTIIEASTGTEPLTGYTHDEIVGQHYSVLFPKEDRSSGAPEREIRKIAASRYEVEGWRLQKDGSRFWANIIGAPIDEAVVEAFHARGPGTEAPGRPRNNIGASRRTLIRRSFACVSPIAPL